MNSALSPREIQARLRAGASIPEVATEAGVEVDRISGFAIPVMAERAHMTRTALAATVRRRGDASGHRRLGELIHERLQARGLDDDSVEWDSWRQNDLKWRLVGLLDDQAASRAAEFVFDPKGRFSVADNADARWMIGEEPPGSQGDPDNENTIDFHDELALVRATADDASFVTAGTSTPGDDVPPFDSPYQGSAHTSELDELYDMLSGVSEDSVRIYLGLDDDTDDTAPAPQQNGAGDVSETAMDGDVPDTPATDEASTPGVEEGDATDESLAEDLSEHPDLEPSELTDTAATVEPSEPDAAPRDGTTDDTPGDLPGAGGQDATATPGAAVPNGTTAEQDPSPKAAEQDPLVPDVQPAVAPKRKPARKRASIPSWDEIMFGGPSPS